MEKIYITLTIALFAVGCCKKERTHTNELPSLPVKDTIKALVPLKSSQPFVDHVYQKDSVRIDLENIKGNFHITSYIGDYKKVYNIDSLQIPVKYPDLLWVNDHYACMFMWWSQAQSRHLFIPTQKHLKTIYLDKDIEAMDSVYNNIVYIDTIMEKPYVVIFNVENLLTRKTKSLKFNINEQNPLYPFYDTIQLTKNKLTIASFSEIKSVKF